MARKSTPPAPANPKLHLSAAQIDRCLQRIEERIQELENFSTLNMRGSSCPELQALETSIEDTLERSFGADTSAFNRFSSAFDLHYSPSVWVSGMPEPDYRGRTASKIANAVALLGEAKKSLQEDLLDLQPQSTSPSTSSTDCTKSRKIFLVHGHDETVKQTVARFLENLDFEVVILHEQPNGGRTIIEKIEKFSDVGFAVVLLTPDDEGGVKGAAMMPRARQNVILELGFFIGLLGRGRVCALLSDSVEIPSDYSGVIWQPFSGEWKTALSRELQEAGYEIDWNKAMRR